MSEKVSPLRAWRLKRERAGLEWSQVWAAELFGVGRHTWIRWEQGDIPAERVLELSDRTGIPRAQLRPDLFGPRPSAGKKHRVVS
jgi:DNA-binding XRE family transcriptional regulator